MTALLETSAAGLPASDSPRPRVLNIGCGEAYLPGALNIDPYDRTVCDLRAYGQCLPLGDGCMDEVQLLHVLEHIGYLGSIATLAECQRVLAPGGRLVVEALDAADALRSFEQEVGLEGSPAGVQHLFGRPSEPGMGLAALLPERLLHTLLEAAGFVEFALEPPRTWLSQPGLRLVARRSDDPRYLLLARCRSFAASGGLLDGLGEAERLELEAELFDRLRTLPELPPAEASTALLRMIVVLPVLAAEAIRLLRAAGLLPGVDLDALARVAEEAVQAGLDRELWQAVRRFAATATVLADPVLRLEQEALGLLSRMLETPGLDPAAELERWQRPLLSGHTFGGALTAYRSELPERGPFLRSRVKRAAARILASAVGNLARGRLERGRPGLHLTANLRQDPVYPYWNLAVLQARKGNLERAITFYRSARGGAQVAALSAALEREEAACLAALGRTEEAAWLWRRARAIARRLAGQRGDLFPPPAGDEVLPEPPEDAELQAGASEDAALDAFPPPRIHPVMVGEGVRP